MMESVIWGTLIVSATNEVYFSLSFEQEINDGLMGRAVGRYNETEVYPASAKRSGNENGTIATQNVCLQSSKATCKL